MGTPSPLPASRCSATTVDGNPCSAAPIAGSDCCAFHDPVIADKAHSAGGRARATQPRFLDEGQAEKIRLANPKEVPRTLELIARWAATGALDAKIANAIGALASTTVRAADTAELEQRLEALESTFLPRRNRT